jgi:hypothetical protein
MLHGMEHAGWIKLNRDASGNILRFEQVIKAEAIASAESFGKPYPETKPPTQVLKPGSIDSQERFETDA